MSRGVELCIDQVDGRFYAAVVRRGVAQDLYIDTPDAVASGYGAVFAGRVTKVDKAGHTFQKMELKTAIAADLPGQL